MKYTHNGSRFIITASDDKEKYRTETAFFYALKLAMQANGLDVVKKRMWKDGHMTDNYNLYIRDRKWKYCVVDPQHCVRAIYTEFNENRSVTMMYVDWSDNKPSCTAV
jgi:hypothetical protein